MKSGSDTSPIGTVHVAIQGYEGSFHQQAANIFFNKKVTVECCDTFREVMVAAKDRHRTDGGIMAIENSIAGSILPNYNLLQKKRFENRGRGVHADKPKPVGKPRRGIRGHQGGAVPHDGPATML
ncbi:MAG: prephenate dehydratase domain-containing protein [Niabella sp.]